MAVFRGHPAFSESDMTLYRVGKASFCGGSGVVNVTLPQEVTKHRAATAIHKKRCQIREQRRGGISHPHGPVCYYVDCFRWHGYAAWPLSFSSGRRTLCLGYLQAFHSSPLFGYPVIMSHSPDSMHGEPLRGDNVRRVINKMLLLLTDCNRVELLLLQCA